LKGFFMRLTDLFTNIIAINIFYILLKDKLQSIGYILFKLSNHG
jgi:hypothetical protein